MSEQQNHLEIETNSPEQTAQVGEAVGRCCAAGDIIALQGELGAGKTQFVRGMALGLGLNPQQVSSPTFVMAQEYEPADAEDDRPILVHIDAYRIHSDEELASIGWHGHGEELREDAVVAIEWAKLIKPALGDDLLWVEIEHAPQGRRILLSAQGLWQDKMGLLSKCLRELDLVLQEGAQP